MSFIEMKNIRKDFGKLTILHGVDMTLEKGEVISIIGPSGAGKSTLLRCLNHLETIQGGSMENFLPRTKMERSPTRAKPRRRRSLPRWAWSFSPSTFSRT